MRYKLIPNQTLTGVVKAVHDGDSYKIDFGTETIWIRIWGCDSPEVISNHVTSDQPYGREAGKIVRDLLKGKTVTVKTLFLDQYNRMICQVEFVHELQKYDLTEFLISNGLAWWLKEPRMTDSMIELLSELHNSAKDKKTGLWSESSRKLRPSTWRSRFRRFSIEKEFEDLW